MLMDVHPPSAPASSLADLFPHQPAVESDGSGIEWLSVYVEDCLSTSASCTNPVSAELAPITMASQGTAKPKLPPRPSSHARKRKRSLASVISDTDDQHCITLFVEPPLLLLDHKDWLAESELILPKKDKDEGLVQQQEQEEDEELVQQQEQEEEELAINCSYCLSSQSPQWWDGPSGPTCDACRLRIEAENGLTTISKKRYGQEIDKEQEIEKRRDKKKIKKAVYVNDELPPEEPVKRCTHCMSYKTPQWRTGPLGPKTLCNACGVRYKSGRLLPEYRPANSPTFVSDIHSNSHKKVMQLRQSVSHPGK
ncbi:GATA transcription factor 2-like [Oryza brachyantha]|uniref:GATA-type domain-containing protein n=1 Tax=Oryza brachyantha TaxID=4533 RepID=J3NF60_ORYBR|nr:GATA transcription factor 2-like [Oryza brachyantha]